MALDTAMDGTTHTTVTVMATTPLTMVMATAPLITAMVGTTHTMAMVTVMDGEDKLTTLITLITDTATVITITTTQAEEDLIIPIELIEANILRLTTGTLNQTTEQLITITLETVIQTTELALLKQLKTIPIHKILLAVLLEREATIVHKIKTTHQALQQQDLVAAQALTITTIILDHLEEALTEEDPTVVVVAEDHLEEEDKLLF